ncbi:MAG: hypothetical protein GY940_15380, partial [bacterium]|nr:hypothetical protein [bacterium]
LANTLYYGFDRRYFYLRIDTEKPAARYFEEGYTLDVILKKRKKPFRFPVVPFNVDSGKKPGDRIHVGCAVAEIIELSFPLALLKLTPGDTFYCQLEWTRDGHHFQSLPSHDFFRLIVPTVKDYACSWQA